MRKLVLVVAVLGCFSMLAAKTPDAKPGVSFACGCEKGKDKGGK